MLTRKTTSVIKTNERFTRADNSKDAWPQAPDFIDVLTTYSENWATSTLASAVREVCRNYNVDRIPHVVGCFFSETRNEYGDYFIVEVEYSKSGYRAVYGGQLLANGQYKWQCYMD